MEDLFLSFTSAKTKNFGILMINVTLDAQLVIKRNKIIEYSVFAYYLSLENAKSNFGSSQPSLSPNFGP